MTKVLPVSIVCSVVAELIFFLFCRENTLLMLVNGNCLFISLCNLVNNLATKFLDGVSSS